MLQAPVTLQLGVFFDGTGKHFANAPTEDASNVAKLFMRYPHAPARHQLRLYIAGIGSQEGEANSLFAMATGLGQLGWAAAVDKAQAGVVELLQGWINQQPAGQTHAVVVHLFGFSRGAACARHFANDLCAGAEGQLGQALRRNAVIAAAMPAVRIGFMGLFDTVASILGPGTPPRLQLRADMADAIVHLVAADEQRYNFALSSAGAYDLPLPGAHSDIGGGYPPQMEEQLILSRPDGSYITAQQPLEQAASVKRSTALLQATPLPDYGFELAIRTWRKNIYSSTRGDRVEEVQVHAALEGRRTVRNDLSRLYLHAMQQRAVAHGVPLPVPAPPTCAAELQPLVARLLAYACGEHPALDLSASEHALLYRRYIHHSHHWTRQGAGQTSDLDTLFTHRPEPLAKRRILLA